MIVKSGALKDRAVVLDLKDHQRGSGLDRRPVQPHPAAGPVRLLDGPEGGRVEVIDARRCGSSTRTEGHRSLGDGKRCWTSARSSATGGRAVHRRRYVDTLPPGLYAFWKGAADARVVEIDLRETTADVSGQEIMTADKVTLR
jgi:hypothetical protein